MRWSLKIARIAGTDVKIHATFFLFLAWIGSVYHRVGGYPAAFEGVLLVCLVFVCVLLHEFGHTLAARTYGIRTPSITLLPIGGVALLERIPRKPIQELVISVAGPLVNVVIAAALWIFLHFSGGTPNPAAADFAEFTLPVTLLAVNITLVLFNLIPAFPMDGGRILRAFLAMRFTYRRATQVAARLGQGIALLFGLYGVLGLLGFVEAQPLLLLVAVFVFLSARKEAAMVEARSGVGGTHMQPAIITRFNGNGTTGNPPPLPVRQIEIERLFARNN